MSLWVTQVCIHSLVTFNCWIGLHKFAPGQWGPSLVLLGTKLVLGSGSLGLRSPNYLLKFTEGCTSVYLIIGNFAHLRGMHKSAPDPVRSSWALSQSLAVVSLDWNSANCCFTTKLCPEKAAMHRYESIAVTKLSLVSQVWETMLRTPYVRDHPILFFLGIK